MKKTLLTILMCGVLVVGCGNSNKHEGEAKTPSGSIIQKGRNYEDVVANFEEQGFTNIRTETLNDLVTGWMTKDGDVESVSVDGDENYSPDDWYSNDVEVVVVYHTFGDEENETLSDGIKLPYDNDSAEGVNYLEVMTAFKNAGFTNIIIEKRFDSFSEADTVANIYINGGSFNADSTYNSDDEVRIDYYVVPDSDSKSDIELTQYYAKKTFEMHGEELYSYGFKCHWNMNLINAEQHDDGSWFFKVGVTIENQYGNKLETIAEGVISGTDQTPKVEQFYVSS